MNDDYDQVICSVYRSLLMGDDYSGLLEGVATFTGSQQASIISVDASHARGFAMETHNIDPEGQELYNSHYSQYDPRRDSALKTSRGDVLIAQKVVSNKEIEQSEYFNEMLKPFDMADLLYGVFDGDEKVGISGLSISRGFKSEYFQKIEIKKLRSILVHLENARNVAKSIGKKYLLNCDFQSQEGKLVLLISNDMLFEPLGDDWQFYWDEAGIFSVFHSKLIITPTSLEGIIQQMLSNAFERYIGAAVSYRHANGTNLLIRVSPVMEEIRNMIGKFEHAMAVLEVHFKGNSLIERSAGFRDIFKLTDMEFRVLASFSQTFNLKETASILGVKYETVRWHFKHLLEKTDSRNQAELISRLHQYSS